MRIRTIFVLSSQTPSTEVPCGSVRASRGSRQERKREMPRNPLPARFHVPIRSDEA